MTPPRPHFCLLAALAALSLVASCKKPGRLDLLLRPAENLDLATAAAIEVRLLDGRDDHEIDRATVAGADLASLPNLIEKSSIDPHIPYVFEVRAEVDDEVCGSGRIVGRSLPVELPDDSAVVTATMYVACASEFAPTGRMNEARVAHAAIWAPVQGGALVLGGASEIATATESFVALDSVERYDLTTGRFTELPALLEARLLPGAALDANGRVFVMGGGSDRGLFDVTLDSVEEIDGDARRGKGLLGSRWLHPVVLPLSDGTVALLGIGQQGAATFMQASFYDPATETTPRGFVSRGEAEYNLFVVPMPGRDRALLAGAVNQELDTRPSLFCLEGCCELPCFVPLGDEEPPDPPGPSNRGAGVGWKDAAGAWLACPEGGGTVTIVGGHLGDEGPALDDVWCYRDVEGEPSREGLTRIGSLNHARVFHGVVAVRPGQLLVFGGTDGTEDSIEQAELLRVDPCSCAPLDGGDVTEIVIDPGLGNIGRFLFGGSDVVLGDGTVLLTGSVSANLQGQLVAEDEAWVYMPDLPD